MKKLFIGTVLSTMMFASSAMANIDESTTEPLSTSMMNTKLNQVFDTASLDRSQVMELSSQEMKDTQGAWLPLVYYGVVYGAPLAMATGRWAISPGAQISYHRIQNYFNQK